MKHTPPPGSPAAIAIGCICAVSDNSYSQGYMGQAGIFWEHSTCPIHGNIEAELPETPDVIEDADGLPDCQ